SAPPAEPIATCPYPEARTHLVVPVALTGATATARDCSIAAWGDGAVWVSRDNGGTFALVSHGGSPVTAVALDEYGAVYVARNDSTLEVVSAGSSEIHGTPVPLESLTARDGVIAGAGREFYARPLVLAV